MYINSPSTHVVAESDTETHMLEFIESVNVGTQVVAESDTDAHMLEVAESLSRTQLVTESDIETHVSEVTERPSIGTREVTGSDSETDVTELAEILVSLDEQPVVAEASSSKSNEVDGSGERLKGKFVGDNVFNLSSRVLTEAEISVLSKGLNFCPTPTKIESEQLKQDFFDFSRKMRLKWYFRDEVSQDFSEVPAFRKKSKWQPPEKDWSPYVEVFLSELEKELFSIEPSGRNHPNLSPEEREALKLLENDKSIVIKPADKGSAVVVWDRGDYLLEAYNQLSEETVYSEVKRNDRRIPDLVKASNGFFDELLAGKFISEREHQYLKWETLNSPNYAKMYLLPKIHKRLFNVPGRAVISNCGAVTEKASEFLDFHLKPIMQQGKSYLRDTDDFLSKIKSLGPLPRNSILVTADVVGLYPSIPHKEGLEALKATLQKRVNPKVPTKILVDMAEFVLSNNYFEFDDKIYHQQKGTAIGTKFAPPYACIFMDWFEESFLATCEIQPWAYFSYIDDIFIIWTGGIKELRKFLQAFNNFHPSIKLDWKYTGKETPQVEFLDVTLSIKGLNISYDLYCKPTDCHQYLHYQSCHPHHTKSSSVYSQVLRISKRCNSKEKLDNHISSLKNWFLDRGYPEDLIRSQTMKAIEEIDRRENLSLEGISQNADSNSKETGVVFVATYHPALTKINRIIGKNLHILYRNSRCREVFREKPFVTFRNCKKIKDRLVRAKLPPLVERRGSFQCGHPRCDTCKNIVQTVEFTSNATNTTFKINFGLDCNSMAVIYLITCKICGIQYVGECTTKWRTRWANYVQHSKYARKGQKHNQTEFHKHFLRDDHNGLVSDVEVTLIDKTNSVSPKIRERFWINKLDTLNRGLNDNKDV